MSITPVQVRMARAALRWSVRDLAQKADVSVETVQRAERSIEDIRTPTWGALQRAFEESGIEFLVGYEAVELHDDPKAAAIAADPSMPLGIRRIYSHGRSGPPA
ncbi:multiprotein-bridging factor 1 family protein [Methylobacterium brachiatum]